MLFVILIIIVVDINIVIIDMLLVLTLLVLMLLVLTLLEKNSPTLRLTPGATPSDVRELQARDDAGSLLF